MIRRLLLISAILLALPSTAQGMDISWETAPPAGLPDEPAWITAARDYWASVPGVPTIEAACGTAPAVQVVPDTGPASGWGRTRGRFFVQTNLALPAMDLTGYEWRDLPCRIWFEADLMAQLNAAPDWRGLSGCLAYVHELGHALGLGHDFTGDPQKVMALNTTPPAVCSRMFPPPPSAPNVPVRTATVSGTELCRLGARRGDRLHRRHVQRQIRRALRSARAR